MALSFGNAPMSKSQSAHVPDVKSELCFSQPLSRVSISGGNASPQLPGSGAIMKEDIYDIPSSDEEGQIYAIRRKRRRHALNNNIPLHHDPPALRQTHHLPTANTDTKEIQHKKLLAQTKNDTSVRRHPSKAEDGHGPQQSPQRIKAASTATQALRAQRTNSTRTERSRNTPTNAQSESAYLPENLPRATASWSPSAQKGLGNFIGSVTPSRKRLVDILGTSVISTDELMTRMSANDQLNSTPLTPLPPKDSTLSEISIETRSHDSTISRSPLLRSSRVTYARQRSFLDDVTMESNISGSKTLSTTLSQNELVLPPNHNMGRSSQVRSSEFEVDHNEDDVVRSIHELRQAGVNARYRGAMESIFEDIEDSQISTSGRCNALAQLCGKLLDSKLAHQFVECSFDKRLVNCLSNDSNIAATSLTLCAFALVLLTRHLPYTLATIAWPKLLDVSLPILDVHEDLSTIVRAPGNMLSRFVQKSIQNLIPDIKSKLTDDASLSNLSPCLLALQCMKTTFPSFQETDKSPGSLSVPILRFLVNMVSPSSSWGDGLSEAERIRLIVLVLSILEAHTVSGDCSQKEYLDALSPLSNIYGLLEVKSYTLVMTSARIQTLYLRVILNLTNGSPELCDSFSKPVVIEHLAETVMTKFRDMDEGSLTIESNALDAVILALGILINVTEQSPASRNMFLQPVSTSGSILSRLLCLFKAHVDSISQAHSVYEVHHNVAVGYLAVLLLAVCLNTDARIQVKESFQPAGLELLLSTVDEFLQYHRKIEQEPNTSPTQDETPSFHVRLQDLVLQVKCFEDCL